MHNINHSERLPYEKLAVLGIDREKADSLPQEVKGQDGWYGKGRYRCSDTVGAFSAGQVYRSR